MGSQPNSRTSTDVRTSADHNDSVYGPIQRLRTELREDGKNVTNDSSPTSPVNGYGGTNQENNSRDLGIREKPRANSNVEGKKTTQRTCKKCNEPLTGQFVRALEGTFHLDCFRCQVRITIPLNFYSTNNVCVGLWPNSGIKILSC